MSYLVAFYSVTVVWLAEGESISLDNTWVYPAGWGLPLMRVNGPVAYYLLEQRAFAQLTLADVRVLDDAQFSEASEAAAALDNPFSDPSGYVYYTTSQYLQATFNYTTLPVGADLYDPPAPHDPSLLFTESGDVVFFEALTPGQITAINNGAELYNALDGNDVVTLPNTTVISYGTGTRAWNPATTFAAGAGNDTVTGGLLDDKISGGAGNDTLTGGAGIDTAMLTGRPSDYEIVDNVGTGKTTIRNKSTGEIDTIETFERFSFDVSLGDNAVVIKNAYLTMAQLSQHAYSDAPFAKGWRPLHAHELGLSIQDAGGKWTLANGVFKSGSVAAHIYAAKATLPNGTVKDTLALAFRGSDPSVADPWDVPAWSNIFVDEYYAKFQPLLDAVQSYVATQGIDQVLVTGHSLGGAMAQRFMLETAASNTKYSAATFGSIGYDSAGNDPRMVHFEHTDDIARIIQDPRTELQGEVVRISSVVSEASVIPLSGREAEHSMILYLDTLANLVLAGPETGSLMALKTRTPYFASHWAVGDNGNDILKGDDYAGQVIYSANQRDETLLGLRGHDHLYGYRGADILKGGEGNDTLDGGAGRDTMTGGLGSDDFDFNAVSETGKTASTRDIIRDFTRGLDDIDLRHIDANGGAAGDTGFKFLAAKGAAFTGVKGQLKWSQVNSSNNALDKTIIEGDINGDRRADFQIELTGLKTLTSGDFVL